MKLRLMTWLFLATAAPTATLAGQDQEALATSDAAKERFEALEAEANEIQQAWMEELRAKMKKAASGWTSWTRSQY